MEIKLIKYLRKVIVECKEKVMVETEPKTRKNCPSLHSHSPSELG